MTRHLSAILTFSAAISLGACNATEPLYAQGPWGPRDVHRDYPQYSSPWGRRTGDGHPVIPSDHRYAPMAELPPSDGGSLSSSQGYRYGNVLPADPQPTARLSVPLLSGAAQTEQAAPPREQRYRGSEHDLRLAESPPGVFTAPRRASSYAGAWKATSGTGKSCIVHLSSVAALDLYKASTSRCAEENLRDVNLWKFEDNRISLFARGAEIARLEGSEASLTGSINQSGTTLRMLR